MVQTMYTHVCKCKNYTCWNFQKSGEGEWGREVKKRVIQVWYIFCKNLYKCHNVPTPSTTIKNLKV
jgi:hypothetical protein